MTYLCVLLNREVSVTHLLLHLQLCHCRTFHSTYVQQHILFADLQNGLCSPVCRRQGQVNRRRHRPESSWRPNKACIAWARRALSPASCLAGSQVCLPVGLAAWLSARSSACSVGPRWAGLACCWGLVKSTHTWHPAAAAAAARQTGKCVAPATKNPDWV